MNEISDRQLSIMVFFIPLVFKMAMLPSLLYETAGVDGYICVSLFAVVEFLQLAVVLFVCNRGGMEAIGKRYGKGVYRLLATPFLFVIFIKSVIFVSEITRYVTSFLFYNIVSVPIVLTAILLCYYLGYKGAKSIARLFELTVWLVPVIVLMGILFGKATLEFDYIRPVFANGFSPIGQAVKKYLIYTFDFSPLLFCKLKIKRKRGIVFSSVFCVVMLVVCYMVLYARYGRASFLADCAFARLASFDTVISEIGSLDWISSVLWLSVSLLDLGLKAYAVGQIGTGYGCKPYVFNAAFAIALGCTVSLVWNSFEKALDFVTCGVQYAVFAVEIAVPSVMLALCKCVEKKEAATYETRL